MGVRAHVRVWALACGLCVLSLVADVRPARAEPPGPRAVPVHVLGIDSDDAEDQADAMTGALRSRVRSAPGWSLQETTHALGMLTAALRCPARPDAACLQKIGDQLHTDRFIWGFLVKAPGSQVTAEVHLWARGKPDASVRETYSANLHDQNDETLRTIATRMLEKITGLPSTGTLTVHAGDAEGTVWINGEKKKPLDHGSAVIDLAPGTYDVEVRAQGFATAREEKVVVAGGQDTSVPLKLKPEEEADAEQATTLSTSHTDWQRIAGWSLVGVGAVAAVVSVVEAVSFFSDKSSLDSDRQGVPSSVTNVCSMDVFSAAATAACSKYNDAQSARTTGIVLGVVGGAAIVGGAVLLLTDHPRREPPPTSGAASAAVQKRSLRVLPYAGPGGGGLDLALTF